MPDVGMVGESSWCAVSVVSSVTDVRILICEDEYLLASSLASDFEARGVQVLAIVAQVAEGVALLDELVDAGLNAAIIDIQLIDGPAFPLVERLRERSISVVFFSGYSARDLPEKYRDFPVVTKPGNIDERMQALALAIAV
jgi:ActR/RegA family two-component response regulator